MDKDEIYRRLGVLPVAASVVFASRVAMRWLPFLSVEPSGVLARMGLKRQAVFAFWEDKNRHLFLLATLCAQVGAVGVALGSAIAREPVQARRAYADKAAKAVEAAAFKAANAANAAAYAAAAAAAKTAETAADAAYTAAYRYTRTVNTFDTSLADADFIAAIAAAAPAIISRFADKEREILSQQYDFDLRQLETQPIADLLNAPLWQAATPPTWQKQWDLFAKQAVQLDPSFAIWLQWIRARIAGQAIDLPMLEQWLALPPEIASQSPAAINRYLASLGSAKMALNRVRTIFIGYGDAGKTSLIRALHGEPVVEGKEAMTPGIAIREWDGAGDDIRTHFWDFGGQVMAHATHQFFLRASCLYVLVLSARAEINATEQAEYWLQHVAAFGGNATVLIVGNKYDQTPVHLDMASLQAKYPNVLGFYPLSCTQARGDHQHKFEAFRADFCRQLRQLGTHQVMFTDAQFKVLTELRRRAATQAFVKHAEFDALCNTHRIGKDGGQTREDFLDLLDKLGVVIHFKDLPYLSEHVLNPRWLTYGVYTIMYAHRARLRPAEIVAMLADAEVTDELGQTLAYPPEKCLFITTAMQRFKLCYHLPHADCFIIPGLLETKQPPGLQQANFDKSQALAYKIVFTGFVPRHVMSEMIVERNAEIDSELVWQYGVLLRHREPDARAWAQVDYQARELTIWVLGGDARDYLGILRDVLKGILSRLTMHYVELIRLPVAALIDGGLRPDLDDRTDDWADYAQIEMHRKENCKSFLSGKRKYDLAKIVGLYVPRAQQATTVTHHHHGGQQIYNQPGGDMAGDKTVNISGGVVNGSVVNADHVQGSFNNTTNNKGNPELAALLQGLLAEIQSLNAKVPAAQMAAVAEEAQQLVTESQRPEPRPRQYQACLGGIIETVGKLGRLGQPVLDLAQQVKSLLNL